MTLSLTEPDSYNFDQQSILLPSEIEMIIIVYGKNFGDFVALIAFDFLAFFVVRVERTVRFFKSNISGMKLNAQNLECNECTR